MNWVQTWDGHTKNGNQSYGSCVRVRHNDYYGKKLETLYAHLSRVSVSNGQSVREGAVIGYAGNSGGAHLHFEVRPAGIRYNPLCRLDDDFEAAFGYTPYTYGPGECAVVRPAEAAPVVQASPASTESERK